MAAPPPPPANKAPTVPCCNTNPNTAATGLKKVKVKTTLPIFPLPPLSTRPTLETARLLLVPITQDLLPDFHWIRTTPSNMVHSNQGRVDHDMAETQCWMDRFVSPGDQETCAFAIKLKRPPSSPAPTSSSSSLPPGTTESLADGEREEDFETRAIGMMGVVRANRGSGWPEIGYGINQTHHGRGFGTELLREVLRFWWTLPREDVVVEMEARYVFDTVSRGHQEDDGESLVDARDGDDGRESERKRDEDKVIEMTERVMAIADAENRPSLRVMEKVGFRRFTEFIDEEDDPPVPLAAAWFIRPDGTAA